MTWAPEPAARALARHHLRRSPWMTAFLVAVIGLGAALPMALAGSVRYADGATERFLAHSEPPDLVVNACPPGVDPADGIEACAVGVDLRATRDAIREIDGVEGAEIGGFAIAHGGASPDPDSWGPPIAALAVTGPAPTAGGDPIVVRGRLAHRDAPDEVVLVEAAAAELGIDVGDELHLAAPGEDDPFASEVVGVVRTVDDIILGSAVAGASFHAREGWVEAHADDVVLYRGVLVEVADGVGPRAFAAALAEALPEQFTNVEQLLGQDQIRTTEQAIDFERRAVALVAVVAAVGAAFVVAQLVLRQARTELRTRPVLRSLGASDRMLLGAVLLRWLPIAVAACATATVATAGARMLGPVGIARRSLWASEPDVDAVVVATGSLGVVAVVVLSATVATRTRSAVGHRRPVPLRGGPVLRVSGAFLAQSLRRRGTASVSAAVVTTALALATVLAVAGADRSLARVVGEPARFGAPFDAMIPAADGPPDLGQLDSVAGASRFVGTDLAIGDETVWTQAVLPVGGYDRVAPSIVEGRAPATDGEIVLASRTLAGLGDVGLGDGVEVVASSGATVAFSLVGIAPVTDGYESNVGHGALVTAEGLERLDPVAIATGGGDVAVRFRDDVDPSVAAAELRAEHPEAYVPFPVPTTLQNATRLSGLLVVLAVGAAVLAGATAAHAMHVVGRQRRRDLAVLRALGYDRRQAFAVSFTVAVVLGAAGGLVGVALGLLASARLWALLAEMFGVDPAPVIPVRVGAAGLVVAVALSSLTGVLPSRRAASVRPAEVLRTP